MLLFTAEVPRLDPGPEEEARPLAGSGSALPTVMRRLLELAGTA